VLLALLGALTFFLTKGERAEVTLLRGVGAPFSENRGEILNQIRIKIRNRSSQPQSYAVELSNAPGAHLVAPELPLAVAEGEQRTTSVFVSAPAQLFSAGQRRVTFRVRDETGVIEELPYMLLGPSTRQAP
jgi:hypothetical protein